MRFGGEITGTKYSKSVKICVNDYMVLWSNWLATAALQATDESSILSRTTAHTTSRALLSWSLLRRSESLYGKMAEWSKAAAY